MIICFQASSFAQPNRIAQRIENGQRYTVRETQHPLANSKYDQGRANASLQLDRLMLVLKPSAAQAAELDRFLAEVHDPKSSSYHNWLTPEAYADRFGLNQADIDQIIAWLSAQQLTVTSVARARNAIRVSGRVEQVERAFRTEIHTYVVGGETHYANAIEPALPSALQGVVLGIHGLHDFRLQPRSRMLQPVALQQGVTPNYTDNESSKHYLAPDDFATIFDIKPLYSTGIDGSNQSIVIVGQSRIDASHLSTFRSSFGLGDVQLNSILVPDTKDPGTKQADAQESDLDLQWASAIARNASLIFVYASDVTDAAQYAIDQSLAPVLSMSYGSCEPLWSDSDAQTMQSWAKQGNAEGITWVASSGDSGAAGCYYRDTGPVGATANLMYAVDMPAAVPEITAIGGTTFNEGSGTYWNAANDPTTKASAQSYIPETSWNDSTTNSPAASGGGVSQIFSKPSWQTGNGVPSDDARDVPDLAFPASAQHDGYIVYTTSGTDTGWYIFGGTSAGAPAFSGMLALLNQYVVANNYQSNAGLGNVNTRLYALASSASWAFHDITDGDNTATAVVCGGFLCSAPYKESVGYSAGPGYDLVTGLGSLDAFSFFLAWKN